MCNCVYSRMLQRFSRIATNFFSLFLQFSHTSPVNTDPICVVFIFILMCQIDDKFIIVRLLISQGRSVDAMYQCTYTTWSTQSEFVLVFHGNGPCSY